MEEKRGLTIHFTDGTKMVLDFAKQTPNKMAAMLKLNDVLKKRYMLFEAEGTLHMIPFENVKYIQFYPAPEELHEQTYVKGASVIG